MNKDTLIDKKLIHQRYTTFAYGNLSAPTLRQVGRLLHTHEVRLIHSPTTLARSSHFPMFDVRTYVNHVSNICQYFM